MLLTVSGGFLLLLLLLLDIRRFLLMPAILLDWRKRVAELNTRDQGLDERIEAVFARNGLHDSALTLLPRGCIHTGLIVPKDLSRFIIIISSRSTCPFDCCGRIVSILHILCESLSLLFLLSLCPLWVNKSIIVQVVLVLIVITEDGRLITFLGDQEPCHAV